MSSRRPTGEKRCRGSGVRRGRGGLGRGRKNEQRPNVSESVSMCERCLPKSFHLLHRGAIATAWRCSVVPLGPTRRLVTHLKVSFSVVQQHLIFFIFFIYFFLSNYMSGQTNWAELKPRSRYLNWIKSIVIPKYFSWKCGLVQVRVWILSSWLTTSLFVHCWCRRLTFSVVLNVLRQQHNC